MKENISEFGTKNKHFRIWYEGDWVEKLLDSIESNIKQLKAETGQQNFPLLDKKENENSGNYLIENSIEIYRFYIKYSISPENL